MRLFRTSPSKHLVSCRQTMSGCRSPSQAVKLSTLCLIELMFQVATRMAGKNECKMLRVHPAIRREDERLLTQGDTGFTTAAHRDMLEDCSRIIIRLGTADHREREGVRQAG